MIVVLLRIPFFALKLLTNDNDDDNDKRLLARSSLDQKRTARSQTDHCAALCEQPLKEGLTERYLAKSIDNQRLFFGARAQRRLHSM
jgi:hypothetical protein